MDGLLLQFPGLNPMDENRVNIMSDEGRETESLQKRVTVCCYIHFLPSGGLSYSVVKSKRFSLSLHKRYY